MADIAPSTLAAMKIEDHRILIDESGDTIRYLQFATSTGEKIPQQLPPSAWEHVCRVVGWLQEIISGKRVYPKLEAVIAEREYPGRREQVFSALIEEAIVMLSERLHGTAVRVQHVHAHEVPDLEKGLVREYCDCECQCSWYINGREFSRCP